MTCMEEKMNIKNKMQKTFIKQIKKQILWLILVIGLVLAAATGYAVLPSISLNSPTSFPVDI
jgi:hypothetical protein